MDDNEIVVGDWKIKISEGASMWVRISYLGESPLDNASTHKDLRDLEYAVQKAMRYCRNKLPERFRDEV